MPEAQVTPADILALWRDAGPDRWYRRDDAFESAKWAEHHAGIIRRFGRFPHRNSILGRATTPEEQAFLDEGGLFALMTQA